MPNSEVARVSKMLVAITNHLWSVFAKTYIHPRVCVEYNLQHLLLKRQLPVSSRKLALEGKICTVWHLQSTGRNKVSQWIHFCLTNSLKNSNKYHYMVYTHVRRREVCILACGGKQYLFYQWRKVGGRRQLNLLFTSGLGLGLGSHAAAAAAISGW